MYRVVWIVTLFVTVFAAHPVLTAQTTPIDPAIEPGFRSIRADHMRANLTFLSSAPLAGRLSLERGSEVAIQWIASEFAKAGLQPANNGSFLQPVELVEYHPDLNRMRLSLVAGGKRSDFKFATDFVGLFPENVTVTGRVVFAGYGITAPEFGYDDYAGIDAKGKIVVIFDHEPQEGDPRSVFNGIGSTRYANSRLKVLNAQRHGAVGVILMSEPNRTHPSNIERQKKLPGYADRLTKFPSQALLDNPLKIPLFSVTDATAQAILAAAGKNGNELQSQIDRTLRPASTVLEGVQLEMQVVNADRRQAVSDNVVGMIEGTDPQLKNETIIYSSHLDHEGIRNGQTYPGADDNGSGTVGVVELAQAFMANKTKPKRTLLFITFTAEERGLLGSYYYVDHPLRPLASTRAVINFDMIGRNETPSTQTEGLREIPSDTSNQLSLIGTIYSPQYRAVVEKQNARIGLTLDFTWDEDAALSVFQRSDHFPFALRDVPAMWWFTGFHPDYHQPTDTVDKINFTKMEQIMKLAYLTGWAWASGAAELPVFHANTKPPTKP